MHGMYIKIKKIIKINKNNEENVYNSIVFFILCAYLVTYSGARKRFLFKTRIIVHSLL